MKKLFSLIMLIALGVTLSACTIDELDDIPIDESLDVVENTTFEYPLLQEVDDEIKEQFNIFPGFGIYMMYDKLIEGEVDLWQLPYDMATTTYSVTAYPDHVDGGSFITEITTSESANEIYGISPGDSVDEETLENMLEEMDFDEYEIDYGSLYTICTYKGKGSVIRIYLEGDIVKVISVRLVVSNRDNIQF